MRTLMESLRAICFKREREEVGKYPHMELVGGNHGNAAVVPYVF